MNDSNNNNNSNILNNNNVLPQNRQFNNMDSNLTSETENIANVSNSTLDVNSVFGVKSNPRESQSTSQNEIFQFKQELSNVQPQNNFVNQVNNNVNNANNVELPMENSMVSNTTTSNPTVTNTTLSNSAPINPAPMQMTSLNPTPLQPASANIMPANDINLESSGQPTQNFSNNTDSSHQTFETNNQVDDNELLRAFIGSNYEKITTRPFNFAGFFFSTFYMFYRKMFGFGILTFLINLFILNIINNFIVTIIFTIAIGFLVNKLYLFYAKKKISSIKAKNPQKSLEELKSICAVKGGTSVGKIFLGFLAEIGITIVILIVIMVAGLGNMFGELVNGILGPFNWDIMINDGNTTNDYTSATRTLLEDIKISNYSCFVSNCNVTINDKYGNSEEYELNIDNSDFFGVLSDYEDYIKIDIYYVTSEDNKIIVDYKTYLKSNNEDISNISTEDELRNKLGLYIAGTHTALLTLKEIGTTGFGFSDNTSYTYTDYIFIDSKNNQYEMRYKTNDESLYLTEGLNYNVTFEVTKEIFDYEYNIISIN